MVDTRQLQHVIAVIEHGSLGRAASVLNLSQPALTKSIQRLEERLGVSLFSRESKGMRPTLYGEALRSHAHGILASTEQAIRELEAMHSGAVGTVRVAAGPLVSSEILSRAAVKFLREKPDVRIKIHTAIGNQLPGLMAGQFDFILAQLPLGSSINGLLQHELINDRISVIARSGHPLARRKRVLARDLLEYRWVLPEVNHSHRIRFSRVFEAEGLPMPEADLECGSTEFIKAVVSRSDHLGLIASMGIKRDIDPRIVEISMASPFMVRPIGIVWRRNQVLSSSSLTLMSAIQEVCGKERPLPKEVRGRTRARQRRQ
jgi:DNA-binding transcriptional LysR family regulator